MVCPGAPGEMRYRKFGSSGFEVSVLSFGARHLHLLSEDEAIKLVQYAVSQGINYFDVGYPYDMEAYLRSLEIISRALKDESQESVKISLTIPAVLFNSISDLNNYLERCLRILGSSKVDFCLLGELNRNTWPKVQRSGVLGWLDKALEEGRIEGAGFSFHDDTPLLREIVSAYERWVFCQIRYNYVDVNHHPGVTGLKYAASSGLAVVVTDPFKEGNLLKDPPEPIAKYWRDLSGRGSLAEWALRWIWNHPEVSTVLVDVRSIKELSEYAAYAERSEPDSLSIQELIAFENIKDAYLRMRPINCATCYCCMPCPQGIDVPRIFELYNDALTYNDVDTARFYYRVERHRVEDCIKCGECEMKCPRRIPIISWLEKARELLSEQS